MIELLSKLRKKNIHISLENENLKLKFDDQDVPSELIEEIKKNKDQIIQFLKSNNNGYNPILQVIEQESYVLTPSQKRFWVLSQLEEGSLAYDIHNAVKINGNLNTDKLVTAFKMLIERHEILRTYFKTNEQGDVRQYIGHKEEIVCNFKREDFSKTEDLEQEIQEYFQKVNKKAFDLEKAPLIRAAIIKTREQEYIFFLSLNHIIGDGWSMQLLVSEIIQIYNALLRGLEINLPKLTIQYKDYAAWFNEETKKEKYLTAEQYWLNQFSGELPVLNLPGFKSRPLIQTYNGKSCTHVFSKEFLAKIKSFSREQDTTLFMTLMAGIKALLYRYSGQDDIIVGTPIAGREHPDLENQLGLYLNIVGIRTQFKKNCSFLDVLQMQKETLLLAYKHQQYQFDDLISKLDLKRDLSRSTLFDIIVVLQNQGQVSSINYESDLNEITFEKYEIESKTSQSDISFTFVEAEELVLNIEYNTDIYDAFFIQKIFNHFEKLILGAVDSPKELLENIEYVTESEKNQILAQFNATKNDYPRDKTIITLFEEQVARTPNNIAVVYNEKKLTYQEIHSLSNQLAAYLVKNYKIQTEELVAIKLERTDWFIVAVLGVLKSGAAYVPIDTSYPQERINYIEEDSKCKTCIDYSELEKFKEEKNLYATDAVLTNVSSGNLAYVIYTSGTTGQPKGVMIEHQSLCNLCNWHQKRYKLDTSSRGTLFSSLGFDASVWEIFPYLTSGGSLFPLLDEQRTDLNALIDIFNYNEITHAYLPTALYNEIYKNRSQFKKNIKLLVGGESLNIEKASEKIEVYNNYGPSENTVVTTSFKVQTNDKGLVSIGNAIDNVQTLILNNQNQLCSVGIIGEICIGGDSLARGYLNNEELTAEKFIESSFVVGNRLYKTGDLGRWQPDGTLEFIGRKDNQVKIRGNRVELGEIEYSLLKNEEIDEVVVTTIDNDNKEKELVAYFTSLKKQDIVELKTFLKETLPEYMIPAYYVQVQEFPLTVNGKIDKKSLPLPDKFEIANTTIYIAPRNSLEQELVSIWEKILERGHIGINDDFFMLGGHSLKAIRLISQYHKSFNSKLSLKELFVHTTISSHSKLIASAAKNSYLNIPVIDKARKYSISDAQRRLWVLSQFEGGESAYNIPTSMDLTIGDTIEDFKKAIYSTIDRHEILRTVFKEDEFREICQWIVSKEEIGFDINYLDLRQDLDQDKKVDAYIYEDSYKPFDLINGPLIRSGLIQLSDQQYVFYFNMHHIISDGWSLDVMIKDVLSFYKIYQNGGNYYDLPELRIQYKDYASWQLDLLKSDEFKRHKAYWIENLAGELPLLDFPSFKTRPLIKTYKGHHLKTYISPESVKKLSAFGQSHKGSLFMGLLSVWNILCYRYTANQDIIIGTPVAGRDHSDLDNQIGFYTNTIALRNMVNPSDDFEHLFDRIKESTLAAYSHQMYPFDRLASDLTLKRDMGRSIVFDVMLTLQNTKQEAVAVERNVHEFDQISDLGECASKFDIDIIFKEEGDYLSLDLTYNSDIYQKDTVEVLIKHYKKLLEKVLENPKQEIGVIDFLQEDEKQKLLSTFNTTTFDYASEKTIIDLFEEQVKRTPDNIAIVFEGNNKTYKELDEFSNQLANYLISVYGVNTEDLVGVKLKRSDLLIISILAILKTTGAYVPIDPGYPQERIEYILDNSNCKLCIDIEELKKFEANQKSYSIYKENNTELTASNLVYVIYTSGSTGTPKGVMVEHGSLSNLCHWHINEYKVNESSRSTMFSGVGFDASAWEIFPYLLSGAMIYPIVDEVIRLDVNRLTEFLSINEITHAYIPTQICKELVRTNCAIKGVKILTGGDSLILSSQTNLDIFNNYGPTENTIVATSFKLNEDSQNSIPIGKPIFNNKIYILSENLELQPIGVAGEICISGSSLARGYLNDRSYTDKKFIRNPFTNGEKIYKTGDLARWLPDGTIEFIGRKDSQVQIRGYRIELYEIEYVLMQQNNIEQVVVNVVENANNNKLLVAYLVLKKPINKELLRVQLSKKLPNYMIPNHYVFLETMPLTVNGKINYKELPELDIDDIIKKEYQGPRNEIERNLVNIWEKVLKVNDIGIYDNFFELGGNSMMIMELLFLIESKFELKLTPNDLFKFDSVIDQAIYIDNMLKINVEEFMDNNEECIIEI